MLQVKTSCELKLAADCDNANLITDLVWSPFSTKEHDGVVFPKNTGFEVIKLVCSLITGTWSPEKCVTDILSSNLFVVSVPFPILVLKVLKMHHQYTVTQCL